MTEPVRVSIEHDGQTINIHLFLHYAQPAPLHPAAEIHARNLELEQLKVERSFIRNESIIAVACDAVMQRLAQHSPQNSTDLTVFGHTRQASNEALRRLAAQAFITVQTKPRSGRLVTLNSSPPQSYQPQGPPRPAAGPPDQPEIPF